MTPSEQTSGELVRRASDPNRTQAERHQAFGALVVRFQDMAWGCAYARLGDTTLAEEAAQDGFISAWRHLEQLREPDAFGGWLGRIVVTRCHRLAAQKRDVLPLTSALELAAPDADAPPERLLQAERAAKVRAAVWELPEQERTAVILFYIGDYDRQEVADFLGISLVAVKKRLAKARARLKERLLTTMQEDLQPLRPSESGDFAGRVLGFTKLFSALIDDGISLTASLDRLADQETDAGFRAAILQVRADVSEGVVLSQAMRKHPQFFSERYIAVIREGEVAGALEFALNRLADGTA